MHTLLIEFLLAQVADNFASSCVEHFKELAVLILQTIIAELIDASQSIDQFTIPIHSRLINKLYNLI